MNTTGSWLHGQKQIQLLLHWRWFVIIVAIPISLVIELMEGKSLGLHLLDEVILDGLILPVTTFIVLTLAARRLASQTKREEELKRRQHFTDLLAEHREYYDLANFLVRFPASVLPVEHCSLQVIDPDEAKLTTVTEWRRGSPVAWGGAKRAGGSGHDDEAADRIDRTEEPTYQAGGKREHPEGGVYCLVLLQEDRQVGVLQLCWQSEEQPSGEALRLLNEVGPEIAAALARAIEDAREAERVRREAQAYERRRLTQELHDSLAQQIFYLNLSIDQLADDATLVANEAIRAKLAAMHDVAADVYEQIRNNLSILRAWEQVNLTEAVSELVRAMARDADLDVIVDVQGTPEWLSPHTCEHIYGAVREAMNNVVKHAGAQEVQLRIHWSPEHLRINVIDNGMGFDPQLTPEGDHYGLILMREALEAMGGELRLISSRWNGTDLGILLPIRTLPTATQAHPSVARQMTQPVTPSG